MPQILVALAGDGHPPPTKRVNSLSIREAASTTSCGPGAETDFHLQIAGKPANLARAERLHREQVVDEDAVSLDGGGPGRPRCGANG